MTIREPFDTPSGLPDGRKMISPTADPGQAPGNSTFYFARMLTLAGGNYKFKARADDAVTFWIGKSQLETVMLMTATLGGTDGEVDVYLAQGDYRLDAVLVNIPAQPNPAFFDLLITQGDLTIYASAKEGWVLDDTPISDSDIPPVSDYRFGLPVFSVLPNWQTGVLERLTWQTDVLDSERDAEQRRSVRRNARRSFEATFGPRSERTRRNRLDSFFVGTGPAQFMVPLWHEAVSLQDGLDMEAAGVFFQDGELFAREFRKGDLVFVNSGDPDDYDVLQVGDVEAMRFSWAFPPPRSWPKGTRIYPMRVATVNGAAPRMSNITDRVATATARFDLVEPYTIEPAWGNSVGGQPLFRFIPDRTTPLDVEFNRRYFVLDNDSGVPVTTDYGRYTFAQLQMRVLLFGRRDAYSFRQFLQAARGQARHFYMSTFQDDVTLAADIPAASSTVLIMPQGFVDSMRRPQPIRTQLAFQFKGQAQTLYRTIIGVEEVFKRDPDGSIHTPKIVAYEQLTIDSPLPSIALNDLRRVSFVCETRFAQDGFELLHSTNTQAAVSTSLVFRQATNPRKLP